MRANKKGALSSAYGKSLDRMLYAVVFLGLFGVVPLISRSDEISGYSPDTLELYAVSDGFPCYVCLHVYTSVFLTLLVFRGIATQYCMAAMYFAFSSFFFLSLGLILVTGFTEYGRESPLRKLWDERPRCFCICFMI